MAAPARPAVKIGQLQPLVLRGQAFKSTEAVRLSVRLNDRVPVKLRLRANAQGGFVATLRQHRLGRCGNELTVSAVGGQGSRVAWTLRQLDCDD